MNMSENCQAAVQGPAITMGPRTVGMGRADQIFTLWAAAINRFGRHRGCAGAGELGRGQGDLQHQDVDHALDI